MGLPALLEDDVAERLKIDDGLHAVRDAHRRDQAGSERELGALRYDRTAGEHVAVGCADAIADRGVDPARRTHGDRRAPGQGRDATIRGAVVAIGEREKLSRCPEGRGYRVAPPARTARVAAQSA